MKRALLVLATFTLYALHQDVWFWRQARPLVFGFLPIGLVYHVAYCFAAAALLCGCSSLGLARAPRGRVIPTTIVFVYLAVVLYIGIFAFRQAPSGRRWRTTSSPGARWARSCS